ncbi:MAG TPA: hypothetical protein VL486_13220 [Verrucomicrobiae bacterium]|nr:hypothetical protein [Verrucomicrobiae bacterium]
MSRSRRGKKAKGIRSRSQPQSLARPLDERAFAVALTASYLVVATLGALHHEMWRDELHGWLLARGSATLGNVFQVTRYEAHFVLWRVFLFGITRFTHNPLALQLFSICLATTTVWIVARFSPFRKVEKCLLSFGYFFLFEYGIIAQDYTMIVLLMVSFCALYRRRERNAVGLAVVLFLLANTAPYGFLIALIFSAFLVFDWIREEDGQGVRMAAHWRISALIVLAGLACATLQLFLMKTAPGTSWKHPLTAAGLETAVLNIWRAYVPVPVGFPHWTRWGWGSNFIDAARIAPSVKVGLALLLGLISTGLLWKRPAALFLYLVGVVTLVTIQFVVNVGAPRHQGFLFVLFVGSLWIAADSATGQSSRLPLQGLEEFFRRWRSPFVVGLLVIQAIVGGYVFGVDWNYDFSASKPAARFLRDSSLAQLPIVGSREAHVAPLAAYLDGPIYYLESARFGTYADLSRPGETISARQVISKSLQLARQMHTAVVLVLDCRALQLKDGGTEVAPARITAEGTVLPSGAPDRLSAGTITFVKTFVCFVDEGYFIYLIRPN